MDVRNEGKTFNVAPNVKPSFQGFSVKVNLKPWEVSCRVFFSHLAEKLVAITVQTVQYYGKLNVYQENETFNTKRFIRMT